MKLLLIHLLLFSVFLRVVTAWYISTPFSKRDWEELAMVVTQSFDAPSATDLRTLPWLERLQWNLAEKHLTYSYTYNHHVKTARKMKGLKYSVFVAKDEEISGKVVGVVEIGIKVDSNENSNRNMGGNKEENEQADLTTIQHRRPTIGSLCVDSNYRELGIGAALVKRCEKLVTESWKEDMIFAEVHVENEPALALFVTCGFAKEKQNNDESQSYVMVNIRRRRKLEQFPHFIMEKRLNVAQEVRAEVVTTKQWIW